MEKYKLDIVNKTLTITKGFADAVASGKGAEFKLYIRLMKEIPGLTVVRKSHKSPSKHTTKDGDVFNCNQFKNLKYENMERFISALPDNAAYLEAYNFIKNYASKIQTNGYALVRRWFVAQFPEFRKNPLAYLYNTPKLISASSFIAQDLASSELKAS